MGVMTAIPPMAEAGLAALLAASIWRAFFGAPPPVLDRVAALAWVGAGAALTAAVLLAGQADRREILIAAAVEAICVAGWWLRRGDDDGPDHPELDCPGVGGPDSGIDWDEFDRERAGWRPHERV
jgi:hypothetical protein